MSPIPKEFPPLSGAFSNDVAQMTSMVKKRGFVEPFSGVRVDFSGLVVKRGIELPMRQFYTLDGVGPATDHGLKKMEEDGYYARFGVRMEFTPEREAVKVTFDSEREPLFLSTRTTPYGFNLIIQESGDLKIVYFRKTRSEIMGAFLILEPEDISHVRENGILIGDRYFTHSNKIRSLALPGDYLQELPREFPKRDLYVVERPLQCLEARKITALSPFGIIYRE